VVLPRGADNPYVIVALISATLVSSEVATLGPDGARSKRPERRR
jgi:hypothetical protein